MSWDHRAPAEEAHKRMVGGVMSGYAGHLPNACNHYGSTATGDLPFTDRHVWDQPSPMERRRRNQAHSWLNKTSSADIGRQCWNLEWAGHGGEMLKLLNPKDLEKYRLTDKIGGQGRVVGLRNLEAALNKLERESGIDLDGDGDIGEFNAVPAPAPTRASFHFHSAGRVARPSSAGGEMSERRDRELLSTRSSSRLENEPPLSERHGGGKRVTVPGYSGHNVRAREALGSSVYSAVGFATSAREPTETEQDRLQHAMEETWTQREVRRDTAGISGYTGHMRGTKEVIGASHRLAARSRATPISATRTREDPAYVA